MESAARRYVTPEEYFAIEERAEVKSEYYQGELFAMAGGSPNHSRLQRNLTGLLYGQLRGRPCEAFTADLRVQVEPEGLYTYPDLSVACGGARFDAHHNLQNPVLLAEVLSPTTEGYDRGKKFDMYRQLESLRQYLLISQDERVVHLFTRGEDGRWTFEAFSGPEAVVPLASIDCRVPLGELYEGLELTPRVPQSDPEKTSPR